MVKSRSRQQSQNERNELGPIGLPGDIHARIAKIQAIANLENINPKSKGIWLLTTAGFTWDETTKILHVSKNTVRDVLAGKEIEEE